jgi:hypothetical protein
MEIPDIIFLASKEQLDFELILKLYQQGKIITSGLLFQVSQKQEINNLIARRIFNFE